MTIEKSDFNEEFFKKKFPYFIHQLQNSVQLMSLNWELFRDHNEEPYLEEVKEQIVYIEKLFSTLDESFFYSEERQSEDFFIQVEFGSLLQKVYKEFLKRKTSYKFSLELPEKAQLISVNVFYIQEALRIIFENAVKYTPKGEKIFLKLRESEENIEIILKNTGIGIEKDLQKKIFEPFERGNSKKKGLGLGLNIARKIIQIHRGKIVVESDEKSFVSFIISLPKSRK